MQNAIPVSKYNEYIKQIFEAEEFLHHISVVGEVSSVSLSRQVIYFSLKDQDAQISCVCFNPNLMNQLEEGQRVIITGSPNYYTKLGKLSFNVSFVEKAGVGDLYIAFLQMKEKLEKLGYFDESNKKEMPQSIKRIGVITSKEGAVIQDIKSVVARRDESVDIVLYPVKVQGAGADIEIANAIKKFDEYGNVDVLIVARGGGSLEDLMAFNSEVVAKATFECCLPIISAVGHETDWTIIDFVADLRAPTPSIAGEFVTKDKAFFKREFKNKLFIFENAFNNHIKNKENIFNNLIKQLVFVGENSIFTQKNKLNNKTKEIINAIDTKTNEQAYYLAMAENSLQKLSPIMLAKKGYAKIEQDGQVVDSCDKIVVNSKIDIYFHDGKITATPENKGEIT